MDSNKDNKKVHRVSKAGAKANKKKAAKLKRLQQNEALKGRNPKAFIAQTSHASIKEQRRILDKEQKRINLPVIDRSGTAIETPPYVVAVVGPPQCGKTTLIRSLIKNYTRHSINEVKGPITIVAGKKRRLTFIECNNDLNSMIDTAKVADLVLLLIDASYGFEMETFEFLNILKTHGFPKVIGILTHLDGFKNNKKLKKIKKKFKDRFWTEIYEGAKLFYLSGIIHGKYPKVEIHNLARFISVANFIPLSWRNTHPYVHIDRVEDITDPELVKRVPTSDRTICLYGYVRGTYLKPHMKVHIPGSGDYVMKSITSIPDPCPLPQESKKTLNEKERLIYAPMCDIGNSIIYDNDAVYINIPDSKLAFSRNNDNSDDDYDDEDGEGESMVKKLQNTQFSIDEKMKNSQFSLFSSKPTSTIKANNTYTQIDEISDRDYYDEPEATEGTKKVEIKEQVNGRVRRKVKFVDLKKNPAEYDSDDDGQDGDDDDQEEDNSEEEEDEETRNEVEFDEEDDLQSDEEYYDPQGKEDEGDSDQEGEEEEEEEEDNSEDGEEEDEDDSDYYDQETGESSKWKEKMKSSIKVNKNPINLSKLIYGDDLSNNVNKKSSGGSKSNDNDDDFLTIKKGGFGTLKLSTDIESAKDALDSAKYVHSTHDFNSEDIKELLKKKFVSKSDLENVGAVGKNDSGDGEDQALFGDFEDLETGQVYEAGSTKAKSTKDSDDEDSGSDEEDDEEDAGSDQDGEDFEKEREKNKLSKKEKQIEKINSKYEEDEKDFEGELNANVKRQREINEKEFAEDDAFYRTKYEGFPIGVYVRVEFEKIPCEFIKYFDPKYPVVVGGLLSNEENLGMINTNIKKHRWHKKILKSNDPLIISVGWRRFQTMVLYSTKDINGRNRMLKYTPEHMHCYASFYGPLTPPGTAFVAFTNSNNNQAGFRVSATGTVLDLDSSINVVKKLKLIGQPDKILKKTCFVNGMFTSRLEVAKFVGATIRTVSGIRGTIKKPLSHPEGSFRATFEDKLIPSDIIFLRTWYTVTPTKFYNPVTSLLQEKKTNWQGMKTVGQLRYENNLSAPVKKDSNYEGLKVQREEKSFKQFKIPIKLQAQLPFDAKPKQKVIKNQDDYLLSSRVNIVEPHEQQVSDLLKRLQTIKDKKLEKDQQRRDQRESDNKKKQEKLDSERERRQKQEKKRKSKLEALGKIKKKSKMG